MTRATRAALWAAVALCLPGVGCDLFAVREPDAGSGDRSFWEPPTAPEIIVRNLETALENGVFNDYRRAFAEDFLFHPDPVDSTEVERDQPGAFADWDREVETVTAEVIQGAADSLDLVLSLDSDELSGDDRLLKENYVLTLYTTAGVTQYQGQAWFLTRQLGGGEWFIQEWTDVRTSSVADSWGLLKGRSRLDSGEP